MLKESVAEVIMDKPYAFVEEEVDMTYKGVSERCKAEGKAEGKRETAISLVAVVKGENKARELAEIENTEELLAAATRLLGETSTT
jgi:hypothetical protein